MVQVPRQRNTREENAVIKDGSVPSGWKDDPAKLRQKDTDTRWIRKNGVTHYGDKNHVSVDRETKLIANWDVTPANVYDSQVFEELWDPSPSGDPRVYADSAYRSGDRGKPLTPRQIALNRSYSMSAVVSSMYSGPSGTAPTLVT